MTQSEIYHVGQSPYSRIGVEVQGASTLSEVIERCDALRFTVEKRPLMVSSSADGNLADVRRYPGKFATVRTDTGAPLGIVAKNYKPIQLHDAMSAAEVLAGAGEISLDSAGVFRGGARVWLSAKLGEYTIRRLSGGEDPVDTYLMFANGHDGKWTALVGLHGWRIRCNNQIPMVTRGLRGTIKLRHVGDVDRKLADAYSVLLDAREEFEKAQAFYQTFADTPMRLREFRTLAAEFLDATQGKVEAEDGEKQAKHKRETRAQLIEELEGYFTGGVGNTGESLWDGLNSITEWLDHKTDRLDESKRTLAAYGRELESIHAGKIHREKAVAVRMLAARR